jgi:hypothetical protein
MKTRIDWLFALCPFVAGCDGRVEYYDSDADRTREAAGEVCRAFDSDLSSCPTSRGCGVVEPFSTEEFGTLGDPRCRVLDCAISECSDDEICRCPEGYVCAAVYSGPVADTELITACLLEEEI